MSSLARLVDGVSVAVEAFCEVGPAGLMFFQRFHTTIPRFLECSFKRLDVDVLAGQCLVQTILVLLESLHPIIDIFSSSYCCFAVRGDGKHLFAVGASLISDGDTQFGVDDAATAAGHLTPVGLNALY
ncbi:hypothetical protein JMJ77_0011034 [Colletotrichum scovillei]|uniref:Uncharacterized protein n=1 Tax=Colletotrichum scovillei TaxID=1209932 RepID=A0A9P7R4V1_9PEZI|nr:hypothetical protein JMJ77_0011034 [Colletotrichum scovillei]KAG7060046.1 hypothetical protein JMJ78_0015326 [Colletotrichum scovillei]KAG7067455.1 hypothetical protein JMJ76_0008890 [Colletotrichum scovillei]